MHRRRHRGFHLRVRHRNLWSEHHGPVPREVLPGGVPAKELGDPEQLLQVRQPGPLRLHLHPLPLRPSLYACSRTGDKELWPSRQYYLRRHQLPHRRSPKRRGCGPHDVDPRPRHAWRRHRFRQSGVAVPLYLSEMAPAHLRGGLNMMFQLATTLGIFSANMINYGTQKIKPWGWRLSLGLVAAPALLMTVGGFLLPETPNSLIERGHVEEGRRVLELIRGTTDVDAEFTDMAEASELANTIKHPFRNILERRNRPQLVMAVCMPAFQILTGINSILFYAPVLFQSMGFGASWSLYSSMLTGAVLLFSTLISIATVDRLGRRKLLISGGILMIICQVIVAAILGVEFGSDKHLSRGCSTAVVFVICLFMLAFGWSWGPLGWTVPSEIFPLETRSAGQSITVAVNLFFTFVIAQAFLSLLCVFKYAIFIFFAGWIAVMTAFVYVFLPETKGVPIEEMVLLWSKHRFWKNIMPAMPTMPLEDGWGPGDGRGDSVLAGADCNVHK
ncbi:hypothetical protein ACQJBY_044138 [Aegilops geniculata]